MQETIKTLIPEKWLSDAGSHIVNIENMLAELIKIQSQLLQIEHNKQEQRNKRFAGTEAVRKIWR